MLDIRHDHEQLRSSMESFALLMDAADDVDHASLLKERMLFSQRFAAHLAAEHEALERAGRTNPILRPHVQTYRERIARLRSAYSSHIQHWTPAEVWSDWSAYRLAVLGLQAWLRETMAWEEKHLPL